MNEISVFLSFKRAIILKKGVQKGVFQLITVILAAGQGKRLRSSVPKPLVKIKDKTMIEHVIEKAFYATESRKAILVINPDFEGDFLSQLKVPVTFAYQSVPKGTADALAQALNLIENGEDILVMYADLVLISRDSLKSLVSLHIERNCDITFLSGTTERRYPYALVERDERGRVIAFQEKKVPDFDPPWEFYIGPIILKKSVVEAYIEKLSPNESTGEIYIADIVSMAIADNKNICGFVTNNEREFLGVNTPEDLKAAEEIIEQ